ncbi:hypothetical protein N7493_008018 [Penicillium malachiteum]|uniref:Uncharacterized protein n=1 Tax=Penicillium malachiteum TaxID=1324776 RepID=A0AAD6HGD9_9EURO|nr:hypothetical protein N7493_008018 [Penicillium malachiteum]
MKNMSMLGPVTIQGEQIPKYATSIAQLRRAYYTESLNKNKDSLKDSLRRFPVLSPFIDTIATLKKSVSQRVPFVIDSNSGLMKKLLQRSQKICGITYDILASLLGSFQPSSQFEADAELSDDYIKAGFLEAFEVLKEGARESKNITIRSAVITIADFLDENVRELAAEAAKEAGIATFPDIPIILPTQTLIWSWKSILDDSDEIIDILSEEPWGNSLLIDYGVGYFDIATNGRRCQIKYPMDIMGCQRIAMKLVDKLTSFDGPLKQQVEKGASKPALYSALWTASNKIRHPSEIDPLEDSDDHHAEWPLDLQDWWIGDEGTAILRWEDLEAVEAEYIDELANQFERVLDCLQGESYHVPLDFKSSNFPSIVLTTKYRGNE